MRSPVVLSLATSSSRVLRRVSISSWLGAIATWSDAEGGSEGGSVNVTYFVKVYPTSNNNEKNYPAIYMHLQAPGPGEVEEHGW